jgi:hypothetical protein
LCDTPGCSTLRVCCACSLRHRPAFTALGVGSASERSTREVLRREAATLLPAGSRVLTVEYREPCYTIHVLRSPPCVSARFRLAGTPATRATAFLEQAGDRWRVTRESHRDGWDLSFRRGEVRAVAYVRNRRFRGVCLSPYLDPLSCEDYLRVEVGPPTVFRKLEVRFPPAPRYELIPDETRRRKPRLLERD